MLKSLSFLARRRKSDTERRHVINNLQLETSNDVIRSKCSLNGRSHDAMALQQRRAAAAAGCCQPRPYPPLYRGGGGGEINPLAEDWTRFPASQGGAAHSTHGDYKSMSGVNEASNSK